MKKDGIKVLSILFAIFLSVVLYVWLSNKKFDALKINSNRNEVLNNWGQPYQSHVYPGKIIDFYSQPLINKYVLIYAVEKDTVLTRKWKEN
jgi:hypothetical protein